MALNRPSPERRRLLAAVEQAHDEWVGRRLRAGNAEFTPRRSTSDYNQHYIDVEASPAQAERMARRVAALRRR